MVKRVVEVSNGSGGGFGIVGVIIGALLVLGVIFFFAGGREMIAGNGGSSPSVTVNTRAVTPTLPSGPRSSTPATTGSSTTR